MGKVTIIAECGVNWRALCEADKLILGAAEAGADIAKFQCYKEFPTSDTSFWEMFKDHPAINYHLNRVRLKKEDIRYLYYRCEEYGIEFMATPMYVDAIEMLDPYVDRWKIRYADRHNQDIINACYDTGKEMLISCKEVWDRGSNDRIKYLYCDPTYPPKEFPATRSFVNMDGYSCHIPSATHAAFTVKQLKLDYLEMHVRLNKYSPNWEPTDQRVSVTINELNKLCEAIR
jgi:sialic acid synthase SpsE